MFRDSKSLKMVHDIQEKIYEKTKHMTSAEKIAYINKAADEVEKKYGLKLRKASHVS